MSGFVESCDKSLVPVASSLRSERALIYQLFLQEKAFEERTLPVESPIVNPAQPLSQPDPLYLTRISNVKRSECPCARGSISISVMG